MRIRKAAIIALVAGVAICVCGTLWFQPKPITKHLHHSLTQKDVNCTIHYVTQHKSDSEPNEQLQKDLSDVWQEVRVIGPLPAKRVAIDAEEVHLYLAAQTSEEDVLRETVQLFRESEAYFINVGSCGYRVVSGQSALGALMNLS